MENGRLQRLLIFIVAYNAARTIENVLRRIPTRLCDAYEVEILIIDDESGDETFIRAMAAQTDAPPLFKITTLYNPKNQGYGGNQKIGYHYAIENKFDFVALLHGDGQYAPELLPELIEPLRLGVADAVFGSRMLEGGAIRGGMPLYKFVGNRILTAIQNFLLRTKLSEFHSGYRIYSVEALKSIPFERNTNVFHFDTEIIIQLVVSKKKIVELPIPTYYGDEICHVNGMKYAKDVIKTSLQARLQDINLFYDRRFDCVPIQASSNYPSKMEFDSSHLRIFNLVAPNSRVLDLGSGLGAVGAALKTKKGCTVVGCDVERGPLTNDFDEFYLTDLNLGPPNFGDAHFDYILLLDVIEHLRSPEDFLDQLRELSARSGATVVLTTANVGFLLMRALLLFGRFEYGKRGILDLTHTRLFTWNSLRRTMQAAGFELSRMEGIGVPVPFVFGNTTFSKFLIASNKLLSTIMPKLFGFQLLFVANARPTLATLLRRAQESARHKQLSAVDRISPLRKSA